MSIHNIVDITEKDLRDEVELEGSENLDQLEAEINSGFDMPSKFTGKSAEDIAKSYVEQEKLIGRQGAELGQLRKTVDQLIQKEVNKAPEVQAKPVDADDLLDRPEETIRDIVKKELESVRSELNQTKQQLDYNDFVRKHPDYTTVSQTPEFQEWVASSERRLQKFQNANYNMDLESADDLLTDYKELDSLRTQKATEAEQKRKASLQDAQAERGVGESGAKGKRTFKRSELRQMRMHNTAQFDAMQPEIIQAYRDGRVIDG